MIRLIWFFVKLAFPRKSANQINGHTLKNAMGDGPALWILLPRFVTKGAIFLNKKLISKDFKD